MSSRFAVAAAALLLLVAVATAVAVVQPVADDTTPGANPGASAVAFVVAITAAVATAVVLLWWARWSARRRWPIVAAIVAAFLAINYFDAAAEFRHRGPDLEVATAVIWAGTGTFVVAAALCAAAAVTMRGARPSKAPDDFDDEGDAR